jgi:predicted ATP-grasp superfamily ATP-dependent carboligase
VASAVLVVGFSARALGRSALAAGFDVVTLDGFGDRDLLERAPRPAAHRTVRPFTPGRAAAAGAAMAAGAVTYASNLENHPRALARLAAGRPILGNAPATLARVRHPARLATAWQAAGVPAPRLADGAPDGGTRWMLKPRRGGGGRGVRPWTPGESVSRHEYLQELVDGVPGSLVFLADGRDVAPVALTRQLVGDPRFGGWGCCYVGNTLASRACPAFDDQPAVYASALRAAEAATAAFGLVGLNTVDFMARDGVAWPIEVNPRPGASVELAERALGVPLFAAHVEASLGLLPAPGHDPLGWTRVPGKAVLYATRAFTVRGGDRALLSADVADISADGERIPAGGPVCTVFAQAASHDACVDALAVRGRAVLHDLQRASEAA